MINLSRQSSGIFFQNFLISDFCNAANSAPLRCQQTLQDLIFFKFALQVSHFGVILITKKLKSKLKHFRKSRYSRIFGIHNIKNWICTSKQAGNTLKSDELRSTAHRTNQIIFLKIYELSENSFFFIFCQFYEFQKNPDINLVRSGHPYL